MLRARIRLPPCGLPVIRPLPWRTRRFLSDATSPFQSISQASPVSEPSLTATMISRARSIATEHAKLSQQLAATYDTELAKKVGELSATTEALSQWEEANNSLHELHALLCDPSSDADLRSLAAEELDSTTQALNRLSTVLKTSLLPVHPFAHLPCLIEFKPGAGGSEAALFAAELLRMYTGFCKRHRLRSTVLSLTPADGPGEQIAEAVLEVDTPGAYGLLRGEAGVHRVQRVPATEAKGRTHTSAVSVLVLPSFPSPSGGSGAQDKGEAGFEDPDSDYYIDPKEVRTDIMRARGAGGQHVNTTDSAVRLTHAPSGIVVSMQDSRSQHANREKAWRVLRSRVAQERREKREAEMVALRRGVVGVARMGRGDKVRTYNWGQQRVTDHRPGLTVHALDEVVEGGAALDEVVEAVRAWMVERELEVLEAEGRAEKESEKDKEKAKDGKGK